MSSRFPCIALAATAALAVGCGEPTYHFAGYTMYDRLPLDGVERNWTYASVSDEVDWLLYVEKTGSVSRDGREVVTLEHSALDTKDTLTVLAQVDWSSDSSD
ncbi:MAG: hypothetical protein JXB39_02500, partial [Deltaproteobacteria bacterium]|nr:hypothetical protein [Deltaproteobacteria bacterium]